MISQHYLEILAPKTSRFHLGLRRLSSFEVWLFEARDNQEMHYFAFQPSPHFSPHSKARRYSTTISAPAPRSYWASTNRTPTQRELLIDFQHAISYASERWPGVPFVLYGHSLGGEISMCLLDDDEQNSLAFEMKCGSPGVSSLILKNPPSPIPDMARAHCLP